MIGETVCGIRVGLDAVSSIKPYRDPVYIVLQTADQTLRTLFEAYIVVDIPTAD